MAGWVFLLHPFFGFSALRAPNRLHLLHSPLDRRLCEEGAFLEFLQYSGPFILLLEAFQGTIDRFIFVYNYADQIHSPPRIWQSQGMTGYSAGRFSINRREPSFSNVTRIARPPLDVFSFAVTLPMSSQSE